MIKTPLLVLLLVVGVLVLAAVFLFAPIVSWQPIPDQPSLGLIRAPAYQVSPSFYIFGIGLVNEKYCGWHPQFIYTITKMHDCGVIVIPVNASISVSNTTYVSGSETIVYSVLTSVSTSINNYSTAYTTTQTP